MNGLFSLLAGISFIVVLVFLIMYLVSLITHKKNFATGKRLVYSLIALTIFVVLGTITMPNESSKGESHHQTKSERRASESKASSKAESSSASHSLAVAKSKNEEKNYDKFLSDVKSLPSATNNALTDAQYDPDSHTLKLMLNDSALSLSDAELKSVVRTAWNSGNDLIHNDGPFPDEKDPSFVSVYDTSENLLAHSSVFGSFEYQKN